ncbi:Zinc finger C2H2-type [Trinorchestia longiramus]|nr:Zinc finger C2H2-type [Trinorchestia longiramus]
MPDGRFMSDTSSNKSRTELRHYVSASDCVASVSLSSNVYSQHVAPDVPSSYCSYPTHATYSTFCTPNVTPAHSLSSTSLISEQSYSNAATLKLNEKHQSYNDNSETSLEKKLVMHSFSNSANKLLSQSSPQGMMADEIKSSTPPFSLQPDHQQQLQHQQLQHLQMIQQQQQRYHQQQILSNLTMSSLQHMDGSQDKLSSYSKIVANASNGSFFTSVGDGDAMTSRQADSRDTSAECGPGLVTKEAHYYRHPSTSRARSPVAWSDPDNVQSSASSDGSLAKKHYSHYETSLSRQSPDSHGKSSYNNLLQKVGMSFYKRPEETTEESTSPNGVMQADDLSMHGSSELSAERKEATCSEIPLETSLQEEVDFPRDMSQELASGEDYRNRNRLKTYICSLCSFTCRKQVDLINHVSIHPDEKPFHCNQCDYKGAKYHHLRNHVLTHSERSLLPCPQCEYKSYQRGALRVHMRRHSTEKRHGCPHCPYRTHFKGNLKLHLRVHTGEKPYSCPVCEFRCTQSGSLKIHMRGHSGEKPYACEMCDYRSKHKGNLVMHRRKHTGDKPYQCDKCSYKAAQRMGLTKHYKTVHGDSAAVPARDISNPTPGTIYQSPIAGRSDSAVSSAFPGYTAPLFKQEAQQQQQQQQQQLQHVGGHWSGVKNSTDDGNRPASYDVKGENSASLYSRPSLVAETSSSPATVNLMREN